MILIGYALANAAFEIAKPYLKKAAEKAGEAIAGEIGKDAYNKIKKLLSDDNEGNKALAQYQQNPSETAKDALIEHLTLALENKPHEAQELNIIVNNYNLSQHVAIQSGNYTQTTIIQQQIIQGIDPEKHAEVLVAYKVASHSLDNLLKEKGYWVETQQRSDAEINQLKSALELARNKNSFNQAIKDKLNELDSKNDFANAEKLLKQEIVKKQRNELAETYFQLAGYANLQFKYKDALAYYKEAIHLDSENALYLNQAGLMMYTLGLHKDAIATYEKSLLLFRNIYGEQHRNIAIGYNNLGGVFCDLGDYQKALEFYGKALNIAVEIYGDKHPDVATYYGNLGRVWHAKGDYNKAIEFLDKALTISLAVHGDKHPDIAIKYNNLGESWRAKGDYKKAIEFYDKALAILMTLYEKTHPNIAACYNNLGCTWHSLGDYKKAIEYYDKAFPILKIVYGEMHVYIAAGYNNLGAAWWGLGDYQKAVEYHNKALLIDIAIYGDKHPDVATDYNNLGGAWRAFGDSKKAIEFYNKALLIDITLFGDEHPNVASDYNNLGFAWYDLKDTAKGISYVEKALNILKTIYPDGQHPSIKLYSDNLASLRQNR